MPLTILECFNNIIGIRISSLGTIGSTSETT